MKRVVIIDDETSNVENLKSIIFRYIVDTIVVGSATNIEDGIKCINMNNPDVVLLDIDLGTGTGFDLLKSFEPRKFDVIFISTHSNFAIRAFKVCAIDFLLKPFEISELKEAFQKVGVQNFLKTKTFKPPITHKHNNVHPTQSKLALPQQYGYEFINSRDIYYIVADGNYVHIVHKNGKPDYLISKSLHYFEQILDEGIFIRTHNSYIVNILEIKTYIRGDGGSLVINNGARIPVSRKFKSSILGIINQKYRVA